MTSFKVKRCLSKSIEYVNEDGVVPDAVLWIGIGFGVEYPLFKDAWPDADVYGIEAHPNLVKHLRDTYPEFDVTHAAITDSGNKSHVSFYHRMRKQEATSVHPRYPPRATDVEYKVPAITVDAFVKEKRLETSSIFLYMDCEGSELNALRGGKRTLSQVNFIQLEMAPYSENRPTWPKAEEVQSCLRHAGFTVVEDYRKWRGNFQDVLWKNIRHG